MSEATYKQKPVLFSTDLDGTFFQWLVYNKEINRDYYYKVVDLLKQYNHWMIMMINTGRSLQDIQKVAHLFNDITIELLGLNNGQELYINEEKLPSEEWIKSLTPTLQEKRLKQNIVVKSGWNRVAVAQVIEEILTEEGFRTVPDEEAHMHLYPARYRHLIAPNNQTEKLYVEYYGNEAAFAASNVMDDLTDNQRNYVHSISDKMLRRIKKRGVPAEEGAYTFHRSNAEGKSGEYLVIRFSPPNINKATMVQHVVDTYAQKLKAVITAGDHTYNDTELLSTESYNDCYGVPNIPNYPILSGSQEEFYQILKNHPRFTQVIRGDLEPGLRDQINRIKESLIQN